VRLVFCIDHDVRPSQILSLEYRYGWISPFSMSRAGFESPLRSEGPMLMGITKSSWTAHALSDTLLPI